MNNIVRVRKFDFQNPSGNDPYPHLPTGPFALNVKMLDDGKNFVIYLPREFAGTNFGISPYGDYHNLWIMQEPHGRMAKPAPIIQGLEHKAEIIFPSDAVDVKLKNYAMASSMKARRENGKITMGPLIQRMGVDYSPQTFGQPTPIVVSTAPPAPAATIIRPELEHIKLAVKAVNEAVRTKGLQLKVKDDGTLEAGFAFS